MAIHKIDGVDNVNHFPKKIVTLYAAAVVTKGDWVEIDIGDVVNGRGASVKTTVASSLRQAFGVATETVAAGSNVRIQTAGLNTAVKMVISVPAGAALSCDGTTAGAASATGGDELAPMCGLHISLDGSTVSVAAATNTCMIIDQGYF
mgnify:CR=1 FL=1